MLLNIYLGSIALCFGIDMLASFSYESRMKKEGYILKEKSSMSEKIFSLSKELLCSCIPIYNAFCVLLIVFKSDDIYEKIKNKLIKENKICKNLDNDIYIESIDNTQNNNTKSIKRFSELSREEKLEFLNRERENLYQEQKHEEENNFQYTKRW